METINNLEKLDQAKRNSVLFILFGGEHCNVCQTLRPQLAAMLEQHFPQMRGVYVDCETSPEICAQHSVFSLPAVKVYIEGMLITEEARVFSLSVLKERIERPYRTWLEQRD
ncbi:MAG: thioredoxin family protein [Gammaproteobacteria bacterium]|jgi:thioredoxin-like negative regulator of GroEL